MSKRFGDWIHLVLIRVTEEGCNLLTHDHTQADIDKWESDVKNVFKDADANAASAAESAAQEGATNSLMSKGFSKAEAQAMVKSQWEKIKSLADLAMKVEKEAWTLANKFAVGLLAAMAAFAIVGGTWVAATKPHKMTENEIRFRNTEAQIAEIQREAEQTSRMLVDMSTVTANFQALASAPTPVLPAEVPAAVAAVIDVPGR